MNRSLHNTFGRARADRRTIERADDNWILEQLESVHARFVLLDGKRCLMSDEPGMQRFAATTLPMQWRAWNSLYLGELDDAPLFALEIPEEAVAGIGDDKLWQEWRPAAALLPAGDAAMLAHAGIVFRWHRHNRFCGACGREMQKAAGGHARRCLSEACSISEIYPRIDPAIIVLVTHENRCLLGRQASWPPGRYSCLAGFVEAGETLEAAVKREVHEEAGVDIGDITYHSSQPWPFPQSIMLGFRAAARNPKITLHDDELEDARWFTRADIDAALAAGEIKLSSPISIAWNLFRDWYAEENDPDLLDRYAG